MGIISHIFHEERRPGRAMEAGEKPQTQARPDALSRWGSIQREHYGLICAGRLEVIYGR